MVLRIQEIHRQTLFAQQAPALALVLALLLSGGLEGFALCHQTSLPELKLTGSPEITLHWRELNRLFETSRQPQPALKRRHATLEIQLVGSASYLPRWRSTVLKHDLRAPGCLGWSRTHMKSCRDDPYSPRPLPLGPACGETPPTIQSLRMVTEQIRFPNRLIRLMQFYLSTMVSLTM